MFSITGRDFEIAPFLIMRKLTPLSCRETAFVMYNCRSGFEKRLMRAI